MTTLADELRAAGQRIRTRAALLAIGAAEDPTVDVAVSQLLDSAAEFATEYPDLARDHDRETCDDYACALMGRSIAVARAINGSQP